MKLHGKVDPHPKGCMQVLEFTKWPPFPWKLKKGGEIKSAQKCIKLYRNDFYDVYKRSQGEYTQTGGLGDCNR